MGDEDGLVLVAADLDLQRAVLATLDREPRSGETVLVELVGDDLFDSRETGLREDRAAGGDRLIPGLRELGVVAPRIQGRDCDAYTFGGSAWAADLAGLLERCEELGPRVCGELDATRHAARACSDVSVPAREDAGSTPSRRCL